MAWVMNYMPDAAKITLFRERLRRASVIKELFEMFKGYLREPGLKSRGGSIIDATLAPVSKERNRTEVSKDIKAERLPDGWKKNVKKYYGYKNSTYVYVELFRAS